MQCNHKRLLIDMKMILTELSLPHPTYKKKWLPLSSVSCQMQLFWSRSPLSLTNWSPGEPLGINWVTRKIICILYWTVSPLHVMESQEVCCPSLKRCPYPREISHDQHSCPNFKQSFSTRKWLGQKTTPSAHFQALETLPVVWLSGPTNHSTLLTKDALFMVKNSDFFFFRIFSQIPKKIKNQNHIYLCRYQRYNSRLHQILNLFRVLDIIECD